MADQYQYPISTDAYRDEDAVVLPEYDSVVDITDDGNYTIGEDGSVTYTGPDKKRNPFEFDKPSGTDFTFKLGVSTFQVPPTSIEVTQTSSSAATSYVMRSKTSSKMSPGNRQTRVKIRLLFPNLDTAWEGPNSFRGLLAQFRSAPFLPVRNTYLNDVHGIDALALASLNVNTVPGMPYTMSAELICYKFDWKSYVPVPGTFGGGNFNDTDPNKDPGIFKFDAYQYYYMRARNMLDKYTSRNDAPSYADVNFTYDPNDEASETGWNYDSSSDFYDWNMQGIDEVDSAYDDALKQKLGDVVKGYDGKPDTLNRVELYYSDREYSTMMWLNKLGAKQTTDYNAAMDTIKGDWLDAANGLIQNGLLKWFFDEGTVDPLTEGQESIKAYLNNEDQVKAQFDAFNALVSVAEYMIRHEENKKNVADWSEQIDAKFKEIKTKRPGMPDETAYRLATYYIATDADLIDKILTMPKLQKAFRDNAVTWIHEWEMPMRRMGLTNQDLYNTIIVEGITATTQNAIVSLPLTGKVDPVCQFLGGMGTQVTVQMKVVGERAIKHMREIFDSITVSASHNKDAGITGFLGVRNNLINCIGVKYAMLDSWQVNTIEGIPHVYDVVLNLSDFDILQQKKEMPTSIERLQMQDDSMVGHPIMRMSQILSSMNAYPDLPLPRMMYSKYRIKPGDDVFLNGTFTGTKITVEQTEPKPGRYLDPDFYFKSVNMDFVQRTSTKDEDGNDVESPMPNFDAMGGSVTLTPKGDDFKTVMSLTMDRNGDDPYNVLIAGTYSEDDIKNVSVDESNPQSIYNKEMTVSALNDVKSFGLLKDPTHVKMYGRNDQFDAALQVITDENEDDPNKLSVSQYNALKTVYGNDETQSFRKMLEENVDGTPNGMIRAFPTYMVYLIDEGGKLLTYKLFDTFYGLQAVIGMDIMTDKEAPMDTAVIQFSNLYNKLSTPQWYDSYSMPKFIRDIYTTVWTNRQRVYGLVNDLESVQMAPGMRMQIRAGYSANPEALPIVFNGTVTEVTNGSVMTVVVQGDGAELARISSENYNAKASTYSFLGIPYVEPQDLIVRTMGAASNVWEQYQRRAHMGYSPGDASNGLAHFGAILWDTSMFGGDKVFQQRINQVTARVLSRVNDRTAAITSNLSGVKSSDVSGQFADKDVDWFNAAGQALGLFGDNAGDIVGQAFDNMQYLAEDWELLKRNIYPGNGTGFRRFATGSKPITTNMFSVIGSSVWGKLNPSFIQTSQDFGKHYDEGERTVKFNTGGKTNWEIFKMCEHLLPNYVLGVRVFNNRSTLFYGKQNWLYTSGVIPVFDAEALQGNTLKSKMPTAAERTYASGRVTLDRVDGTTAIYAGNKSGIWYLDYGVPFANEWIDHAEYSNLVAEKLQGYGYNEERYAEYERWLMKDPLLSDLRMAILLDGTMPLWEYTGPQIKTLAERATGFQEQARQILEDDLAHLKANARAYVQFGGGAEADRWIVKQTWTTITGESTTTKGGYTYKQTQDQIKKLTSDLKSMDASTTAEDWRHIYALSTPRLAAPPLSAVWKRSDYHRFDTFLKETFHAFMTINTNESTPLDNYSGQDADAVKFAPTEADQTAKNIIKESMSKLIWEELDKEHQFIYKTALTGTSPKFDTLDKDRMTELKKAVATRGYQELDKYAHSSSVQTKTSAGSVLVDGEKIAEAVEAIGTGTYPVLTLDLEGEQIDPDTEPGDRDNTIASVAWIGSVVFGGSEALMNASYYNSEVSKGTWDCMQDSVYYGVLAGTDLDNYAGGKAFAQGAANPYNADANDYKHGAVVDERIMRARQLQIACDNPFSREFAEPVLEIREPFSRFHYVNDQMHIINNGIFADETNVANQIRAIAHNTSANDAKREVVIKADASIPAQYVREKIVDTGLNYEAFDFHDLEDHKNMGRGALRESLQQMYGGELVVLGDPKIRPFDFMYIWDTPNKMTGWCEINRVTHHIGVDTGFITSLTVAPIVVIDDSYLFGMFTAANAFNMDRASREMIASNVAYGQITTAGVQAAYEQDTIDKVVQKSLDMLDGNAASFKTMHMVGPVVPAQASLRIDMEKAVADASGTTIEGIIASGDAQWNNNHTNFDAEEKTFVKNIALDAVRGSDEITRTYVVNAFRRYNIFTKDWFLDKYNDETNAWLKGEGKEYQGRADWIKNFYVVEIWGSAAKSYLGVARDIVRKEKGKDFVDNTENRAANGNVIAQYGSTPTAQGTAAQEIVQLLSDKLHAGAGIPVQLGGAAITASGVSIGVGSLLTAEAGIGLAAVSGPVGWLVAGLVLTGLLIFSAGVGINKFVNWLAEQEPITIMLLSKDGKPLQAGLNGADGIIQGEPTTLPVLSDFLGLHEMPNDVTTLWNKLGFSLGEGRNLQQAETILKTRKMQQALLMSNRVESGFVSGISSSVVIPVKIKAAHDGDTVYTVSPISHPKIGSVKYANTIRMKFVDAPEIEPKLAYDTEDPTEVIGVTTQIGHGAKDVRDWLISRLNTKVGSYDSSVDSRQTYWPEVKVVINTLQPHDAYGRILGILVDKQSCLRGGNVDVFYDDEYLKSPEFDWLHYSINGEMLTDPKISRWVVPFIVIPGFAQVNGDEANIGDTSFIHKPGDNDFIDTASPDDTGAM